MMIALAILGLGLLFIAAALPAGVSVARESADLAVADSAADEALDLIEQQIRTSAAIAVSGVLYGQNEPRRSDDLFRPRMTVAFGNTLSMPLRNDFEPFIKVRPFELSSIQYRANNPNTPFVDFSEFVIERYQRGLPQLRPAQQPLCEFDTPLPGPAGGNTSLINNPVLSPLSRVYPPITPIRPLLARDFIADAQNYYKYKPRQGSVNGSYGGIFPEEFEKAQSRRIGWTAFYRRAAYDTVLPGPDNIYGNTDDVRSPADPLLYEIIVVVTRRPTDGHRFPTQDPTDADFTVEPEATNVDRLLPMPWLVTFGDNGFDTRSALMQNLDRSGGGSGPDGFLTATNRDRALGPDFRDRANFVFHTSEEVGRLLPPGSIIIPAANDDFPTSRNLDPWNPPSTNNMPAPSKRLSGFVPHMPNTLPIYEVIERPDDHTIVCKNNGAYPWVAGPRADDIRLFPCWIIPPSFAERGSDGQPIFDRRTPILTVHRRLIRIPELPQ